MKKKLMISVMVATMIGLGAASAFAQASGTVKGVCRDAAGQPEVGASVEWHNLDNGRKYTLKTNNKGEYFSLGIDPGKYEVTLSKDGKVIDKVNNYPVGIDEMTLDFDAKKNQEQQAQHQGISPEQLKQMQAQQANQQKEAMTVKQLNEKLAAANQASQAGDFETAIATLTEATQTDPSRDLLWARLADAYMNSTAKQTDAAQKTTRYGQAVDDYEKAIDLKQKAAATKPTPDDSKILAAYYNNMGRADGMTGKTDDAVKSYTQAAQLNPAGAAQYYYNLGAILTNGGKTDEAIAAFDKAIAADPSKADAYYQKGVNLVGKATTDKSGKVVAAPGTAEAFNKYLELQPSGPNAEAAKSMLQYIGGTVETGYKKKKN
jgi:tetratricopeptide (TPR) repeat protein